MNEISEILLSTHTKSLTIEVSKNKEAIYMNHMTNQTVQTYKGGTLTEM